MKRISLNFLFALLIGCQSEPSYEMLGRTVRIEVENAQDANLSELYESIEYVFLKGSDQFPLVRPYKFKIHDDLLGIEDKGAEQYVFFDLQGNPQFRISASSGGGPGEFNRTEDFQISNNGITIKDPMLSKFLYYDKGGNFLFEEKSQVRTSYFFKQEDIELHYSKNIREHGDFEFYKIKNQEIKAMVPSRSLEKDVVYADKDGFVFDRVRNEIIFRIPYSSEVVFFDTEGIVSETLEFNFGEKYLSYQKQVRLTPEEKNDLIMRNNLVTGISSFFPMGEGYLLIFGSGYRYSHQVFLDKDLSVRGHFDKITNDIDRMPIKTVPWFFHEDRLGFNIPSSEFLGDYLDRFEIGTEARENSNLHEFVEQYQNELGGDSYVLTFLKVKSSVFMD